MDNIFNAKWIKTATYTGEAALSFYKSFSLDKKVVSAQLQISALGIYSCFINSKRISKAVFAPGWTDYNNRLQYAQADVTQLLGKKNKIEVKVGQGWRFLGWYDKGSKLIKPCQTALIAALEIRFEDGSQLNIYTDGSWRVYENQTRSNNIYNGETLDLSYKPKRGVPAREFDYRKDILIPQQGEDVLEQEVFKGQRLFITPKGEKVIDFGQEISGVVSFPVCEKRGTAIKIRHFEMLDRDSNVYTENLRTAKAEFNVICDGALHRVKPEYTFYGFRYIAVEGMKEPKAEDFSAIAIYSDIKRSSSFECSNPMINQLFSNILWGQRGNFLDIPTDCPQRNERLGWTGDAQVFCKTACFNFDVEKFFTKWLGDMRSTQSEDGSIANYVPDRKEDRRGSAAWGDAAVIIPWQLYLSYGNAQILKDNFEMMEKWLAYVRKCAEKADAGEDFTENRNIYLHNNHWHFGDWLALDLPDKEAAGGATRHDLIGTAFFAYSCSLLIKTCEVLGKDAQEYKELFGNIRKAYIEEYTNEDGSVKCDTQTACVLTLFFGLTDKPDAVSRQLMRLIRDCGHLTTGFVGTPYLLHVLSDIGESKTAYDLLLRDEFPSWCYTVKMGGTTMWERWNGLKPDGSFATPGMNSFNHYAYGAVGDWMIEHMAGIKLQPGTAGYTHILFEPETDSRFTYVKAAFKTRAGEVKSEWHSKENSTEFTFYVPEAVKAEAKLFGKKYTLLTGINKILL